MTIRASPVEVLDGTEGLRLRWMPAGIMTGIAHPGHPHFQQLRIAAAVGLVAVSAVLHDGGMLPEKRPPALRVTAVAVFIDRTLQQLGRIRTAVRIVTTGARDLALAVRHM